MQLDKILALQYEEPFIGNIVLSENEIESIKHQAKIIIQQYVTGTTYLSRYNKFLFAAFVIALRNWSKEDTPHIYEYLSKYFLGTERESAKINKMVMKVVDDLIETKDLEFVGNSKKKYYAILLYHALSPQNTFDSFFDLCWRLYFDELSEYYVKGDSIFLRFAKVLGNKFSKDAEEKDESVKLGSGIYTFLIGLKDLAVFKTETMANVIDSVIQGIDNLFQDNKEKIDEKSYINQLLNRWWSEKKNSLGSDTKKVRKQRVVSDIKQLRPKYFIEDTRCVLSIPSIALPDGVDDNPDLYIYEGNELVYSASLDLRATNLLYITEELELDLDQFDSLNLRIVIKDEQTVLYDSKKTLLREYLLFLGNQELQKDVLGYGNYVLYLKSREQLKYQPASFEYAGNCLYLLSIEADDVLQIGEQTVFFNKEESFKDFWISAKVLDQVKYIENGKEYTVVEGDVLLAVSADIDYKKYGIRYLETNDLFHLDDFPFVKEGDFLKFEISVLNDLAKPESLSIFSFSDNKVVRVLNYIIFENLSVDYDKPFYFDSINVGKAVLSFTTQYQEVTFCLEDTEILFPIGGGYLISNPPILTWETLNDGIKHSSSISPKIWFEDYTNSTLLKVNAPDNITATIVIDNTIIKSNSNKEFKIGEHLYYLKGCKEEECYDILLRIDTSNEKEIFKLATVFVKEKILECPLSITADKRKLVWFLQRGYIGYKSAKFVIKMFDEDKNLVKEFSPKGMSLEIFNIEGFDGVYEFEVYSAIQQGLLKKGSKLLYQKKEILGKSNLSKYRNKELKVVKVLLKGDRYLRYCKNFFIQILDLQEGAKRDEFSGALFLKNYKTGKETELRYLSDDYIPLAPICIKQINDYVYDIKYNYDADLKVGKHLHVDSEGLLCIGSTTSKEALCFVVEGFEDDKGTKELIDNILEEKGKEKGINIPTKRAPRVIKISAQKGAEHFAKFEK